MRKIKILVISLSLILTSFGCSDFLDEKSDLKLATPDRLEDNQMLLNNYGFLNVDFASSGETSSDDYYLTDADYNSLSFEASKRLYTWMPDNVAAPISSGNDWSTCYRSIYICNAVLFNMKDKNFQVNRQTTSGDRRWHYVLSDIWMQHRSGVRLIILKPPEQI